MKTAAAYIRVSDERQDEYSPDSQLKLIRDYCKRNEVVLPDELIFYDDGISAKSVKKRTQFNQMIALAKQKERPFQVILVWKFSRFARNQEESIVYKAMLRKNGVDVVSVSEPIQDNPFGGLIERIIEWMDEYYLIRLSDEVRRGMTERATRGQPNTSPPFGYLMEDGTYVVHPEQSVWIKEIFRMFLDGAAKRTIVLKLRELGVKNNYGNFIDHRGVEYILNNPVYAGYTRWNPYNRSSSRRRFGESSDIVVKSTHVPIISEETWQKTQDLIAIQKKLHSKHAHESSRLHPFMLRGIVKCDCCGSTLVFCSYSKNNYGVQCHSYSSGRCTTSHYVNLDKLNRMVVDEIKSRLDSLDFQITPQEKGPTSSSVDYHALINAERNKMDRAKQAYQEGVDSLSEYKATKAKIEKRIKQLQEEQKSEQMKDGGVSLAEYKKTVEHVLDIIEDPNISEDLKNQALKTIIDKIVFFRPDEHIEIYFH